MLPDWGVWMGPQARPWGSIIRRDIRKLMTSDVASTVSNDSKEMFSNEVKRFDLPKLAVKAQTL
jgi:hypothetical protein